MTIHSNVTQRIIEELKSGTPPWTKPYTTFRPLRHNGIPYRGVNVLILWAGSQANPWWMTLRQANQYGGRVRLGEKSTTIVYAGPVDQTPEEIEAGARPRTTLRLYSVFNAEQIENLPEKFSVPEPFEFESAKAQELFDACSPYSLEADAAFYNPKRDLLVLPPAKNFKTEGDYWHTVFHELIHWTGHVKRLDRFPHGEPSKREYATEELVAEIGAAFLCADLGLKPSQARNVSAYIDGWIKALEADDGLIFRVSSMAEKAVAHIYSYAPHILAEITEKAA